MAVGSVQGKAATLLDLLTAVITETDRALTIGVCCSARDTCDAIVAALVKVRRECTRRRNAFNARGRGHCLHLGAIRSIHKTNKSST